MKKDIDARRRDDDDNEDMLQNAALHDGKMLLLADPGGHVFLCVFCVFRYVFCMFCNVCGWLCCMIWCVWFCFVVVCMMVLYDDVYDGVV